MQLNRTNMKKLASLSALGVGAVALTAESAEAGIIYTVVNGSSGFDAGFTPSYTSATLPGGGAIQFIRSAGSYNGVSQDRGIIMGTTNSLVKFAFHSVASHRALKIFNSGSTFGAPGTVVGHEIVIDKRHWNAASTHHGVVPLQSFSDKYALFEFNLSGTPMYGWAELSLSVTNAAGTGSGLGPDLSIAGYAYDNTGARIHAGDTGTSATPEPSALALAALGALALGAAGLRRWRAMRETPAAPPIA